MAAKETNKNATREDPLPVKSSVLYKKRYDAFMSWRAKNKISTLTEDVLLSYFKSLEGKFKPTSLWTEFSKLKATLNLYDKTDISKYCGLLDWLRKKNHGFETKKAQTFTQEQLDKFIMEAPDLAYLQIKVAVIFGIVGACRRQELHKIKYEDVLDNQNILRVKIMKANRIDRTFIISGYYYGVCKKYMNLRSKSSNPSFFLRYFNGSCMGQNIGINSLGDMGKMVAKVLKLPNPELYTGLCFRRTARSLSADEHCLLNERGWQTGTEIRDVDTRRTEDDSFCHCQETRVAVIFGIMGACSRHELRKLKWEDVTDMRNTLIVNIMKAKKIDRTFAISGDYYKVCKKYMNLRPKSDNPNFFIRYFNGKCVIQNIGINYFGAMGKLVAKELKLPNPESYTGHCFRRTAVNLLVDENCLLKERGWQTGTEQYDDDMIIISTFWKKGDDSLACHESLVSVA